MQEVLRKLEHVQEIDIQINAINKKISEFPSRLQSFQEEIKALSSKCEEKKKVVDELEKMKRQQTGALELNEERAKRSQSKAEQIKNNQEFQAVQKELESLKKNSEVIQENAKKVSDELEAKAKDLADVEAARTAIEQKLEAEKQKLSSEEKDFATELKRLQGLRADAVVGVEPKALTIYDKVRIGRFGTGLVIATAGTCRGCNMRIPPQIYNELIRGQEIHLCPTCRRILVYRDKV